MIPTGAYLFPQQWLTAISASTQLDLSDALLATVARVDENLPSSPIERALLQGTATLAEGSLSTFFSAPDLERKLLPFISRPTFRLRIDEMLTAGRIRPLDRAERLGIIKSDTNNTTKPERRPRRRNQLPQNPPSPMPYEYEEWIRHTDFEITDWPALTQAPGILRPQNYVWNRWAIWFGQDRLAIRIVLLALDLLRTQAMAGTTYVELPPVTASWPQICAAALHLLPAASATMLRGSKLSATQLLRKGLDELEMLGVVQRVPMPDNRTSPVLYLQDPHVFDQPPCAAHAVDGLPAALRLDPEADSHILLLLRTIVRYGFLPVHEIADVRDKLLSRLTDRAWRDSLASPDDVLRLARLIKGYTLARFRMLQRNPKNAPHLNRFSFDKWLVYHAGARRRFGKRLLSDELVVAATEASRARLKSNGDRGYYLRMPRGTTHGLSATQLIISFKPRGALDPAAAALAVAGLSLVVHQSRPAATPLFVPLEILHYSPNYPCALGCNHLHTLLDYDSAFGLLLITDNPADNLDLTCCFRLLLPRKKPR